MSFHDHLPIVITLTLVGWPVVILWNLWQVRRERRLEQNRQANERVRNLLYPPYHVWVGRRMFVTRCRCGTVMDPESRHMCPVHGPDGFDRME